MVNIRMKTCTKCNRILLLNAFLDSSNGRGLHGKRSQCRECQAKYKRELRANAKSSGTKICTVCGEEKLRTEFYRGSNKEGRMRSCKDCHREKMKKYAKENRKRIRARNKKRYHTDEDYRQTLKLAKEKWEKANRTRINTTTREWHVRNPGKSSEYHTRYRTQKANNGGNHTANEFIALCEEYGNLCLACKEERPLTADHIVPVIMGGSNNISNIQPLCQPCNSKKWTQTTNYRLREGNE